MLPSVIYPARPSLSEQQLRFLGEIAGEWRSSGMWPRREKIRLKLRNADFEEALATVSGYLWKPEDQPDRRQNQLRLTVAGLECVPGGAILVAPFVELVRRAAQALCETGQGRLSVGQPDVDAWFPNEPPMTRSALLALYRESWSGGSSPLASGGFWSDLPLEHVRLAEARSAWDYVVRQQGDGHFASDTEAGKLELLRMVYDRWHATGRWPTVREVVMASDAKDAALKLLNMMAYDSHPRRLDSSNVPGTSEHSLRLPLSTVAEVAPGAEADLFCRMIGLVASYYVKHEAPDSIEMSRVTEMLNVTADELARACEIGKYEPYALGFSGSPGKGTASLSPGIDKWAGMKSWADFHLITAVERERTGAYQESVREDYLAEQADFDDGPAQQEVNAGTPLTSSTTRWVTLPNGEWSYDRAQSLGRGGMAEVFRGTASDGTSVAVKIFHDQSAALRELHFADRVLHGNSWKWSINVLDVGSDDASGDYVVVMSLAQTDLAKFSDKRGPLDAPEALDVLENLVSALEELGENVVHRDLKPENVLLHDGKWKLADFGLARLLDAQTSDSTKRGWRSGEYAAPEQWRGEPPTKAMDIYAFACIAYKLLTGKPPFSGNEDELAALHSSSVPPELQVVTPLKTLLSRCLLKHPTSRPSLADMRIYLALARSASAGTMSRMQLALTEVDARIQREKVEDEQQWQDETRRRSGRREMQAGAFAYMDILVSRLCQDILKFAPLAARSNEYGVALGRARLSVVRLDVEPGLLPSSHWDILCGYQVALTRSGEKFSAANLWFAKLPGDERFEWLECSISRINAVTPFPLAESFQIGHPATIDDVISGASNEYQLFAVPDTISASTEDVFIERWVLRMVEAAQ